MHTCHAGIAVTVMACKHCGGHVKGAVVEVYACGAVILRVTSMDGFRADGGGGILGVIAPGPDPRKAATALITAGGWTVAA